MSFRTWSTFNVTTTITLSLKKHCIILFEHVRQFRRNLKRSQKTMFKIRVLKIFDCLKNLIVKIHVQSKIFNLQRVLKKINYMHRDLTKIIFFLFTLRNDSIRSEFLFMRIKSTSIWFLVDMMWLRFDVISNFNDLNSKNVHITWWFSCNRVFDNFSNNLSDNYYFTCIV
jgi:hypothetical protein